MTRTQKFLIYALLAFFVLAVLIFRIDLILIESRPGVSNLLFQYAGTWGITFSFLAFLYFFAMSIKIKPVWLMGCFVFIELLYFSILNWSPLFFKDSFKYTNLSNHLRNIGIVSRSLIQFQDETSSYDPELFYTFKPNSVSRFKSLEYNNEIRANSLGLRDSEENLIKPRVVFLGDSFTMGWGVEEDQCYVRLFGDLVQKKTLNTGISSYGTAREAMLLKRIDLDSTQLVVIQLHDSDLGENKYFLENRTFGSHSEHEFESYVKDNEKRSRYYFFKYLKEAITDIFTSMPFEKKPETGKPGREFEKYPDYIRDYFGIIGLLREFYTGPVLTTYTGSTFTEPEVITALEEYAVQNQMENMYFLNLAADLDESDYFYYDDHLNSKGHLKVAERIFGKVLEVVK